MLYKPDNTDNSSFRFVVSCGQDPQNFVTFFFPFLGNFICEGIQASEMCPVTVGFLVFVTLVTTATVTTSKPVGLEGKVSVSFTGKNSSNTVFWSEPLSPSGHCWVLLNEINIDNPGLVEKKELIGNIRICFYTYLIFFFSLTFFFIKMYYSWILVMDESCGMSM